MDTSEVLVVSGGIAAIAWVVWFFFLGDRQAVRAAATASGIQQISVRVKGGYEPDRIVVEKGRPVRLDFHREETSGCSDTVVLSDFGISRPLPAFKTTSVEFTPEKAGEFTFTCGMSMLRGRLVVEEGAEHGSDSAAG